MSHEPKKDLAASVRQRLLNLSRHRGEDFQRLLRRFAQERLLYRLSRSEHQDRFTLKGALLFVLWATEPYRSTKDLDLLGRGAPTVGTVVEVFRSICTIDVEPDGLDMLPNTVVGAEIREEQEYGGIRITFLAMLGNVRIPMQVDVGFGDQITPGPVEIEFPVLLDLPAPRLRAYPQETVVAEKLEAMVSLGLDNSRMKDFFDLWTLSREFAFEGSIVAAAVAATFERRGTRLPAGVPVALTEAFSRDPAKVIQWTAFLRRSVLAPDPPTLEEVITQLARFLLPILAAVRENREYAGNWRAGEGWRV